MIFCFLIKVYKIIINGNLIRIANSRQRYVYGQWRGLVQTTANKYLPLEIPQEFPSKRGQAIAYTHLCCVAFLF